MSNYVQVRYQTSSSFSKNSAHDLRNNKVDYLRNDMFHNKYKNYNSENDAKKLNAHAKILEQKFKELYKKRVGRNPQVGKASAFNTGIITLSNSINEKLANEEISRTELDKHFKKAIKDQIKLIKSLTGTEPELIYFSIHYDEKTPHAHFVITNYDEEGRSLAHKMKDSQKLSRCQDKVGESFRDLGFIRGEIKATTNAKHKNIRQMHEQENKELEAKKLAAQKELKELIKKLQEAKKEAKQVEEDKVILKNKLDIADKALRETREALKSDRATILSLEEKKTLLEQNIAKLAPIKDIPVTYDPKSIIDSRLIKTTVTVKTSTFKSEERTFKEIDIPRMTQFITEQNKTIERFRNAPLVNKELEAIEVENSKLTKENQDLSKSNDILRSKLEIEDEKKWFRSLSHNDKAEIETTTKKRKNKQ